MSAAWRELVRSLDPLRVAALLLLGLPIFAVFGLGVLWLWQAEARPLWLAALAACALAGYGLQQFLVRRDRRLLAEAATEPDPDWPPGAQPAWERIEALANGLEPAEWPLDDGARVLELARRTLETVAHCYHPQAERPLLELTVPHALLIIERASRDLRRDIADQIPFSHRLTLGDILRVQRWKDSAERAFALYRAGRLVINPADALLGELWRHLRERSFGVARQELERWLLRALVRKLGYYAIDLYSGRLPLDEGTPVEALGEASRAQLDAADAAAAETAAEPLRIAVLGRANAGKSSLVNALFGRLAAAVDALPGGGGAIRPFVLERDGLARALVLDTPACDDAGALDGEPLRSAVDSADLLIWVSAANRPDRAGERAALDALRARQAARPERRPAPLVVAASHIDLLRPAAEWQPPYDLAAAATPKAAHIRDAVAAIAADLDLPPERVVPVCLAADRVYNVDDALWAALLGERDAALRARLLRCLETRRREENWTLLRRQLAAAGRLLARLPDAWR